MFRYIAFSWTPTDESQAHFAERLERALLERGAWHPAFEMFGHKVFMTGNARAVNDAYQLPPNQGVVLGRLFRRGGPTPTGRDDVDLSDFDAQRIVHSNGRSLIEQFWGRYVAFLPSGAGDARVLRDPTGALPCFHLAVEGVSIVFSWMEDLFQLLHLPTQSVDWDAVAAHMLLGRVSGHKTTLDGVTQVLAGELTPMTASGDPPLQLWSAADIARRPSSAGPAATARLLRDTVAECARSWASCYESFVLRLSGGVDSSILLGVLSEHLPASKFVCLNYHSSEPSGDERAYARLAAQERRVPLIERAVDEDILLESLLTAARTPLPLQYVGSMATGRTDADVASAHQAGAVFNGAGGDQLFFEVQCTWPAADYLKVRGLDQGFIGAVLDAAHLGRVSFWSSLWRAVADNRFKGNPVDNAGGHLSLMPPEAIDAATRVAHRFVHSSWLAAQDLPIGKFHQLGMVISPLEYYNHHLREAAPERVHPLMSQPLMELCLSTPTFVLSQGGRGRGLARAAFTDSVPTEILNRRSKGQMENYIVKVLQRNRKFAREVLLDGVLAKHGLLDRQRAEGALADHSVSSPTRATEIHTWLACEAWLRVVMAPRRPAST